jgi:hypothetical protein
VSARPKDRSGSNSAFAPGTKCQVSTTRESLDEILLEAPLGCPATERAARSDPSVFDRVEELAAWLVSDPDARISVGEILRVAEEGVPRPDRDPEERDGTG